MKRSILITSVVLAATPAAFAAGEGGSFFDATFWAFVGLVIFLGIVAYVGGFKALTKSLDDRADRIRRELDEAKRLREEAEALRNSFKAKEEEARKEAAQIVAQAKIDADALMAETRAALAEQMKRRNKAVDERIARAEAQASADVKAAAIEAAIAASEKLIAENLDAKRQSALIDAAIAELPRRMG
jgi:F-type H+-transporting ATPase subunit b